MADILISPNTRRDLSDVLSIGRADLKLVLNATHSDVTTCEFKHKRNTKHLDSGETRCTRGDGILCVGEGCSWLGVIGARRVRGVISWLTERLAGSTGTVRLMDLGLAASTTTFDATGFCGLPGGSCAAPPERDVHLIGPAGGACEGAIRIIGEYAAVTRP